MNPKTYTSNISKLLKQMDKLSNIQEGVDITPVQIHVAPTNKCNLSCSFCCFADRDKGEELNYTKLFNLIGDAAYMGVKSIEFNGGGEPTLYGKINEAIEETKRQGMNVGLITNGTLLDRLDSSNLNWLRISMNAFDWKPNFSPKVDNLKTDVSGCYIWNDKSDESIKYVSDFVRDSKIITRVTPNCIQSTEGIEKDFDIIRNKLSKLDNPYLFLSDFNTRTTRDNNNCYMHMIKPMVGADGNIYVCPSHELAVENGKILNPAFKLGKMEDIISIYNNMSNAPMQQSCSYCKYSEQNSLLDKITERTNHNGFC